MVLAVAMLEQAPEAEFVRRRERDRLRAIRGSTEKHTLGRGVLENPRAFTEQLLRKGHQSLYKLPESVLPEWFR